MRGRLLLAAAALAAACESSTAPPAVVRLEAASATIVTGTVGTAVTPVPAVRATSENGTPLAGVAVSFRVAHGGGAISNKSVKTGEDGVATAGKWTLGPAVGNQTVTAGAGGPVEVVFTAITEAGPVAQIISSSGNDQIAAARDKLLQPLHARVADSFGNPVAGAAVTFTVIAGEGSIESGVALTRSDGIAVSGLWTLGPGAGVQQVRAESGTAQVVFSAHAYGGPPTGLQGQLAFVSEGDGNAEIYVINADRSGLRRLTTHSGSDYDPAWSPDGSQIAFASDRDVTGDPSWETSSGIYVMAADGSNVTRRTRGIGWGPAWSPSGSAIAFAAAHDGQGQIATVGSADGTIVILTDYPGVKIQPAWSPDGRQLAFVSDYAAYDFVYDIYTMSADGTGRTQHTKGFGGLPNFAIWYLHPAWSPDGSMIAFVYGNVSFGSGSDVRYKVAVMSADGVFIRDLASAGDIPWMEAGGPLSLTWSPDGRHIAYTFVDLDAGRLTDPLCDQHRRCSRVRSVKYVSLDGSQQGTIISNAHSPSWRQ